PKHQYSEPSHSGLCSKAEHLENKAGVQGAFCQKLRQSNSYAMTMCKYVIYISTTDCVLSALTHYCTILQSNPMLQFFSIAYTHEACLVFSKLSTQIPTPLTHNATTFTTLSRSISDTTLLILS